MIRPLIYDEESNILRILDQRLLPFEEVYVEARDGFQVVDAIREMVLRGAPLIAVAGAYAILMEARKTADIGRLREVISALRHSRPTAVNLFNFLKTIENVLHETGNIKQRIEETVLQFIREEKDLYDHIGEYGSEVIPPDATVMTFCNTGFLATIGIGTAIGVIYRAFQKGKVREVIVPETRPYLQGARLTVYEMRKLGIPHRLITDNTAPFLMELGKVDVVVVGADRVVLNGDVANKIGTLSLALAAKEFGVPFYVALPTSTIDSRSRTFEGIRIEERGSEEVIFIRGNPITYPDTPTYHYAFDITPAKLISGYITERGIFRDISDALKAL